MNIKHKMLLKFLEHNHKEITFFLQRVYILNEKRNTVK